jgi:AcrR family transcriptional regulator
MESSAATPVRVRLLKAARETIEEEGPEALRARSLTARVGTSTQALYTQFGGMPGLIDAVVAEAFDEFARFVEAIPETDDPVADFFAKGWAYSEWALDHSQLYRLMYGLTGGELRHRTGLEVALAGAMANTPQAQRAVDVLNNSMRRVTESGRLDPTDPQIAAGQFLSGTHGYVLLQAGGVFGSEEDGLAVITTFAVNLMVGLGDSREGAIASLERAMASRQEQ